MHRWDGIPSRKPIVYKGQNLVEPVHLTMDVYGNLFRVTARFMSQARMLDEYMFNEIGDSVQESNWRPYFENLEMSRRDEEWAIWKALEDRDRERKTQASLIIPQPIVEEVQISQKNTEVKVSQEITRQTEQTREKSPDSVIIVEKRIANYSHTYL